MHFNKPKNVSYENTSRKPERLLLAAFASTPAILIIDEPTNYLDLASMEALEEALTKWTCTLIIASHDRWLINHWQDRRICIR
ncbi:hypothetical protein [Actinomyces sp.]|uniref:hypothetical protein n=1 Tax=Actinomyces sp. TaxID=29317 RepID=UPI001ECA7ACB|nr:hypothetical protein [Actinomyces sp.]MBS5826480.1 hypothetical protein [Actinomyces sp.]MDU6679385.1 hypothetical protein [Actinomyces sp.]